MFHIVPFAVLMLLGLLIASFDAGSSAGNASVDIAYGDGLRIVASAFALLFLLFYLLFVIGHISISVRRLHDHGEPGIKYLLTFIPLIGIVFWLMMVFTVGNDFENEYGPDPRQPTTASSAELDQVFS